MQYIQDIHRFFYWPIFFSQTVNIKKDKKENSSIVFCQQDDDYEICFVFILFFLKESDF